MVVTRKGSSERTVRRVKGFGAIGGNSFLLYCPIVNNFCPIDKLSKTLAFMSNSATFLSNSAGFLSISRARATQYQILQCISYLAPKRGYIHSSE